MKRKISVPTPFSVFLALLILSNPFVLLADTMLLHDPLNGSTSGTAGGSFSYTSSGDNGQGLDMGQCALFDGGGSWGGYIQYNTSYITSPGTIELWARRSEWQPSSWYSPQGIVRTSATNTKGIQILMMDYTNNYIRFIGSGGSEVKYYTSSFNDGTWHHIAVTWDNSTSKFYIDGSYVGASDGIPASEHDEITLSYYYEWDGGIDEFKIFDYVKIGSEIEEDYSLPVELTSFTSCVDRSGAVRLEWVTESEIENLGFILERREDSGSSSGSWVEIANYITHQELMGQGSVTYRTEYSYTDNTVEMGKTYDYRLADVSYDGVKEYHTMTILGVTITEAIPDKFALYPAYPNPFNPGTTISFDLPEAQQVTVAIYDLNGREVAILTNREYSAGSHSAKWDAGDYGSGIYFYRLSAGSFAATGKLVLVK